MKTIVNYIILANWTLSFFGLGMESVDGSIWGSVIGFAWFTLSTLLLIKAEKKGRFKEIEKRFKIDEL